MPRIQDTSGAPVRVYTLGRFVIEVDARPLRFTAKAQRKPLELLKALIALGGETVPVEQLCESLWPDSDGDRAHSAFATTLSRLRKLIGHPTLELQDGRLTLAADHCWVDTRDFASALAGASRAMDVEDPALAWQHLGAANDVYKGPFLEGEFDPPEILSARERLHGLYLRHIVRCGEFYCRVHDDDKAIELYQKGLEVDDLAEELYQHLMTCYLKQDRLAEGVTLYQRCRQILTASVGIEPSPATEDLYQSLLAAQSERPARAEPPSGAADVPQPAQPLPGSRNGEPGEGGSGALPIEPPPAAPGMEAPEGERRMAALAFFNFLGYRAMTEALDPEEVEGFMGRVREDAVRIVESCGGIVNQFVGEEVQAVFGIPVSYEDNSGRAVQAALELNERVQAISPEIERRTGTPFRMHTGISTGLVVVRPGDERGGRYRIIGEAVSSSAGLLALAKADEILVGPEAQRAIEPYFETKALKPATLGRKQPLVPYRVLGPSRLEYRFQVSQKKGLTPFTGREEELAILNRCLKESVAGQGKFVTLIGEAGMGKSRFFHEFRQGLDRDKVAVFRGMARPRGVNTPYLPFIDALRRSLRLNAEDKPAELHKKTVSPLRALDPALEKYLPYYLHLLSIPSEEFPIPPDVKDEALRGMLKDALIAVTTLSSLVRPMVVLIENWHWADGASDALMRELLAIVPAYPILLVVNYRPEYVSNWGTFSHHTTITLQPLDEDKTGAIMRSNFGVEELPGHMVAAIHERTGGNPFFIEEMCSLLVEDGAVAIKNGQAALRQPQEALRLPATVQAVIRARLDKLGPDARRTLRLAAVIGRRFSASILETIYPSQEQLAPILEELKGLEMIQQFLLVPEIVYRFKHVLIQEVTYETLLLQQRRHLHGRVAEGIEAQFAHRLEEQIEDLARHYQRSNHPDKAIHYLDLAGDKAERLFALGDARRHYRAAIDLLDGPEPSPGQKRARVDISLKWASASYYVATLEHIEVLEISRQYARELDDVHRLAQATYWQGRMCASVGRVADAKEAYEQVLAIAEEHGDEEMVIRATNAIGRISYHTVEYQKGIEYLERATPDLLKLGDTKEWAFSTCILGRIYGSMGDFKKCFTLMEQALEKSREFGNITQESATMVDLGMMKALRGEWPAAMNFAEAALEPAERLGNSLIAAHAYVIKGLAIFMTDDQEIGLALMERGRKLRDAPGIIGVTVFRAWVGEAFAIAGKAKQAQEEIRRIEKLSSKSGPNIGDIRIHRTKAFLCVHRQPPDWKGAHAHMEQAIELAEERGSRPAGAISRFRYAGLLRDSGDLKEASRHLKRAGEEFAELGMKWWLAQARALKIPSTRR